MAATTTSEQNNPADCITIAVSRAADLRDATAMSEEKKGMSKGVKLVLALVVLGGLSIPCIGVLAAVAIPSFIGYLHRAKTAEAEANLAGLYRSAEMYYANERMGDGSAVSSNCATGSGRTPNTPGPTKTMLGPLNEPFVSLDFMLPEPVYFQYEVIGAGGCGHAAGDPLYTFRAHGDLDGDGQILLLEMTVRAGPDGRLEPREAVREVDPD